jgi:hypothetical protein
MILINSTYRYYHTLLQCIIEKDKVYTSKKECNPYIPKGKTCLYWKINGLQVSKKNLLNERYLVKILEKEILPF